jgi:hypothetical protein
MRGVSVAGGLMEPGILARLPEDFTSGIEKFGEMT